MTTKTAYQSGCFKCVVLRCEDQMMVLPCAYHKRAPQLLAMLKKALRGFPDMPLRHEIERLIIEVEREGN